LCLLTDESYWGAHLWWSASHSIMSSLRSSERPRIK